MSEGEGTELRAVSMQVADGVPADRVARLLARVQPGFAARLSGVGAYGSVYDRAIETVERYGYDPDGE